jgi:hypothetical protein
MRVCHALTCLGVTLLLVAAASAQRRRDPLSSPEIDQLRDTALEPELRLKLYVKFARARLASLEQMRGDPKTTDRARQTHDCLEDFLAVYDELNDNIDMYVDRKDDVRKPLKAVIEADTEFQAKLRALKGAAGIAPAEAKEYQFVLSNAIETLDSSAEDHRKLMAEQEEAAKHKRKAKNQ